MSSTTLNRLNKILYLKGAKSFTQYNINRHLITVIGEVHMSGYKDCEYKLNTTVSNLMIERVKKPDTKILLEIFPEFKEHRIITGSKNIMDTYNGAKEQKIDDSKIIGFDIRTKILSNTNQIVLYNLPEQLLTLQSDVISQIYIYCLSNGIGIIDMLHPDITQFFDGKRWIIDESKYRYLKIDFLNDIINDCANILNKLQTWNTDDNHAKSNTIQNIQFLWMKVADYQIVKEIFTLSGRDNLVVLCGNKHAENIRAIFNEFIIFHKDSLNEGDCINLNKCFLYLD